LSRTAMHVYLDGKRPRQAPKNLLDIINDTAGVWPLSLPTTSNCQRLFGLARGRYSSMREHIHTFKSACLQRL